MPTPLRIKRSAVQGKVPTTVDLQLGELGLNTFDGLLFFKKNDGTESIVTLDPDAGGGGGGSGFDTYDLAEGYTEIGSIDLAVSQVWWLDSFLSPTVSFQNVPANRAMVVSIRVWGDNPVTWPSNITWMAGSPPELRASWTLITMLWAHGDWHGILVGGAD